MSSASTAPAAPMRLATSETRSRGEAEAVDRLEPDADVLERRDLGIADQQQLVGVVERREQGGVEQRSGVDHDRVVGVPRRVENGREVGLADRIRLFRTQRRGQHGDSRPVVGA